MQKFPRGRRVKSRGIERADKISRPRFVESKIICRHFVRFRKAEASLADNYSAARRSGRARLRAHQVASYFFLLTLFFVKARSARHKSNTGTVPERHVVSDSPQKTILTRHLTQFAGAKVRPHPRPPTPRPHHATCTKLSGKPTRERKRTRKRERGREKERAEL